MSRFNKPLVLLSGGVDSALLLFRHQNAVPLFVNYGQPAAAAEHSMARQLCECLDKPKLRVAVCPLPLGSMGDERGAVGARVVPGRNAVLLSMGVAWAVSEGCDAVLYGAQQGDDEDYPDCRPEFVTRFNMMANAYGVTVAAPLMGIGKVSILKECLERSVPLHKTVSCYTPTAEGNPCATCNSCVAREAAAKVVLGR